MVQQIEFGKFGDKRQRGERPAGRTAGWLRARGTEKLLLPPLLLAAWPRRPPRHHFSRRAQPPSIHPSDRPIVRPSDNAAAELSVDGKVAKCRLCLGDIFAVAGRDIKRGCALEMILNMMTI